MFFEIKNAMQNGEKLSMSIENKGDHLIVLVAFQGGDDASRTPLLLKGTAEEIDAAFEQQIAQFSEARSGLVSTLDAAKAVMAEAKKTATKTAASATKSCTAAKDDDPKPAVTASKKPAPEPKPVSDPVLDDLFGD